MLSVAWQHVNDWKWEMQAQRRWATEDMANQMEERCVLVVEEEMRGYGICEEVNGHVHGEDEGLVSQLSDSHLHMSG